MERLWLTLAMIGVVLLAAAGLWWGWRNRAARQSDLPDLTEPPATASPDLIEPLTGLYVSTTVSGRWQDRIVAHGLGRRAKAVVHLREDGLLIDRIGDDPVFIPSADLRAIRTAPGIAGKVMATPTGILVFTWALGEAVFTTGMSGYQETLTDPSYRRQVVIATAPQIGNTGWVASAEQDDDESARIWVSGFVVRDLAVRPSNWRASTSLPAEMARQGVVGLAGVDTRALTRRLRTAGAMRCGIFTDVSADDLADPSGLLEQVRAIPPMAGADLAGEVTTAQSYV